MMTVDWVALFVAIVLLLVAVLLIVNAAVLSSVHSDLKALGHSHIEVLKANEQLGKIVLRMYRNVGRRLDLLHKMASLHSQHSNLLFEKLQLMGERGASQSTLLQAMAAAQHAHGEVLLEVQSAQAEHTDYLQYLVTDDITVEVDLDEPETALSA